MKQRIARVLFVCVLVVMVLTVAATGPIGCGRKKGTLTKIQIFPANPSIAKGYSRQLYGSGTLSNGVTYTMTILSWTSSNPEVATVNASGLVTAGTKTGTTTIIATEADSHTNLSDSTTVTVEDIGSITMTPVNPSMAIRTSHQFVSVATLANGATQDLTTSLTWTTSNPGIAVVTNTPGIRGNGLVSTGTTTGIPVIITAIDLNSSISGTTTLTVTSTSLASLAITPAVISIPSGSSRQFTATGTYADGTPKDLTSSMSWTTSDTAIAAIASTPSTSGNVLITAVTATGTTGTVTITATDPITAIMGNTTLTVN